eukprot:scaffold23786_cov129-Isochrysis_galbana.AAC.5
MAEGASGCRGGDSMPRCRAAGGATGRASACPYAVAMHIGARLRYVLVVRHCGSRCAGPNASCKAPDAEGNGKLCAGRRARSRRAGRLALHVQREAGLRDGHVAHDVVALGGDEACRLSVVAWAVAAERLDYQHVATVAVDAGGGAAAEVGCVTDAQELVGLVDLLGIGQDTGGRREGQSGHLMTRDPCREMEVARWWAMRRRKNRWIVSCPFIEYPQMRPLVSLRDVPAAGARTRHNQNVISAPHLTTDSAACHAIPKDFGVEDGKHLTALHSSCIHTACLALKPDLHARRPVTM